MATYAEADSFMLLVRDSSPLSFTVCTSYPTPSTPHSYYITLQRTDNC